MTGVQTCALPICNRPDHQGFSDFINSTSDTEKAKAVCNETLKSLNETYYNAIKDSDYYWIERTSKSTIEETVEKVERHFGLKNNNFSIEVLEIKKVEKDTKLANKLIHFVENFSDHSVYLPA